MTEHDHELVNRAKALAIGMHDGCGHTRSNGEPYWRHPERVVATLVEFGQPDATLAAAWLHDVPEDCPADCAGCEALLERIGADFGPKVGALVREVTNYFGPEASMEEKQARLREHAKHMTADAKWIKLADRWDNISGMVGWSDEKRTRYAKATLALLDALRPLPEGADSLAERIRVRAMECGGSS
jgi:guanosine-3',5'-bis(diphosphate) 3'-pyrophosphohydrolase